MMQHHRRRTEIQEFAPASAREHPVMAQYAMMKGMRKQSPHLGRKAASEEELNG
ncbi:MAG: hypothetical protein RLY86_1740 [Pseudomonadota bacterium]|jgi:hypothetical protein